MTLATFIGSPSSTREKRATKALQDEKMEVTIPADANWRADAYE